MATVEWMVDVLAPCHLCPSPGDYREDRCRCSRCLMSLLLEMAREYVLNDCAFDLFSTCTGPGLCPLLEVTSQMNKVLHIYPLELVAAGCGDVLELRTILSRKPREKNNRGGPASSLPAAVAFALLRWHRCVQKFWFEYEGVHCLHQELMAAANSSPGVTDLHLRLLGWAIQACVVRHFSPFISRLYLCGMRVDTAVGLFGPPSSIEHLTELTLDMLNGADEHFSTNLMEKLQGTSLKKLSLRNSRLELSSIQILAKIVAKPECVLSSLVLWNCELSSAAMEPFWKALVVNSSITLLDISCNSQIHNEGIIELCNALSRSGQAIQRLLLAAVGIQSAQTYQAIGEMLVTYRTLKYLDLSENMVDDKGMAAIAAGIGQSPSLETVLLLNAKGFGVAGVGALADCVLKSANPPKIKLGCLSVNRQEAAKLRTTLARRPAAWQHVEVFWDIQSIADFAGVVKQARQLKEVNIPFAGKMLTFDEHIDFYPIVHASIKCLIETLILTDNVRSLTVMNSEMVGDAELLSEYLAGTKKLRKLKFKYGTVSGWNIPVFMNALSCNESLIELDFGDCCITSCPELAAALIQNRTLESFVCYDFDAQEPGFSQMASSCSLLRFETSRRRIPYDSYHFYECLRTNWRNVLDAATFVLDDAPGDTCTTGSRQRAAAFEKVHRRAELRSQIAFRTSLDEADIARLIRVAEHCRRRAFFRLTQVVNNELTCAPAPHLKLQLDQLGEPILSWICAHLSVTDVRAV